MGYLEKSNSISHTGYRDHSGHAVRETRAELAAAGRAASRCSRLGAHPGLCAVAVSAGAPLVIVNRDPTPYDRLAAKVIREPIGTAVPRLAAALTGDPAVTSPVSVRTGDRR